MLRRNETIQFVRDREIGVPEQHPRTGIPHDHPGTRSLPRLVTVDRAVGAGGLIGAVRAFFEPCVGVVEEFLAIRAQNRMRMLVARIAVNLDHLRHRMPFPAEAIVHRTHCWTYPP